MYGEGCMEVQKMDKFQAVSSGLPQKLQALSFYNAFVWSVSFKQLKKLCHKNAEDDTKNIS